MQILTVRELKEIKKRDLGAVHSADRYYLLKALERAHQALIEAAYNEDYDPDFAIQVLRDTGWEVKDA